MSLHAFRVVLFVLFFIKYMANPNHISHSLTHVKEQYSGPFLAWFVLSFRHECCSCTHAHSITILLSLGPSTPRACGPIIDVACFFSVLLVKDAVGKII